MQILHFKRFWMLRSRERDDMHAMASLGHLQPDVLSLRSRERDDMHAMARRRTNRIVRRLLRSRERDDMHAIVGRKVSFVATTKVTIPRTG